MLRASFGKINYLDVPTLNTGSVSKNICGKKNPKSLQKALKEANETLDKVYDKYVQK